MKAHLERTLPGLCHFFLPFESLPSQQVEMLSLYSEWLQQAAEMLHLTSASGCAEFLPRDGAAELNLLTLRTSTQRK